MTARALVPAMLALLVVAGCGRRAWVVDCEDRGGYVEDYDCTTWFMPVQCGKNCTVYIQEQSCSQRCAGARVAAPDAASTPELEEAP